MAFTGSLGTVNSFNLVVSLIFQVPRNAKALKCVSAAGEGIMKLKNEGHADEGLEVVSNKFCSILHMELLRSVSYMD